MWRGRFRFHFQNARSLVDAGGRPVCGEVCEACRCATRGEVLEDDLIFFLRPKARIAFARYIRSGDARIMAPRLAEGDRLQAHMFIPFPSRTARPSPMSLISTVP